MRRQEKNKEYDVTLKNFAVSSGLLLAVVLAITLLYGSIKGFDSQKTAIAGSSNLLGAALSQPAAGQYFCRIHGAVGTPYPNSFGYPSCPVCGQPMACNGIPPSSPLSTVATAG